MDLNFLEADLPLDRMDLAALERLEAAYTARGEAGLAANVRAAIARKLLAVILPIEAPLSEFEAEEN